MYYRQASNQYINHGMSFVIDGVTYPAEVLRDATLEVLQSFGLELVVATNEPANRNFYNVTEEYNGATVTYINTPMDLTAIRERLWTQIKSHRDYLKESGVKIGDHWFHNDVMSRSQWLHMATKSAGTPDETPYIVGGKQVEWQVMGGDNVPLTTGKIKEVVNGMELNEAIIFNTAKVKRAAIQTMTIEQLEAYDVLDGFPQEYVDEAVIQP
jgi:hypothetical protein